MAETRPRFFRTSRRHDEMIDELMEKTGALTVSEVVRNALVYFHVATCGVRLGRPPKEAAALPGRPGGASKEDKVREKQVGLCNALEGKLNEAGDGCIYTIYEKVNHKLVEAHEQELPLSFLTEDTVAKQYKPDRKECERILQEMKAPSEPPLDAKKRPPKKTPVK